MPLVATPRFSFRFDALEPRLHLARPEPSLAENVRFRLPLATDTTTHYYFDRDETTGDLAWNGTSQSYDEHRGTDFSGGPRGKPVYAAADGVLIAKVDGLPDGGLDTPGNGNYVRINHGNDRNGNPINTVYLHFNAGTVTSLPIGSIIHAGDLIGGVGTSGHSSGLHLHFETQLARVAFDPFKATGSSETSWWVNQGNGTPSTQANTAKLSIGETVEVYDLPASTLSVRNAAAGTTIGSQANGATGTVLSGPTYAAFSGNIDNSLWVWYRVRWSNGLEGWSVQNWLREPPDLSGPTVTGNSFEFETLPNKATITFSEDVGASLVASDIEIVRLGSTATAVPFTLSYDAASRRAICTFSPSAMIDGRYRVRLRAGAITDPVGNPLASDFSYDFHVLAGDANRDATVNFDDLLVIARNYNTSGKTFSGGNVNYSPTGTVDFSDLLVLASRYGQALAPATDAIVPAVKRRGMVDAIGL